jgi:hypothetical protein
MRFLFHSSRFAAISWLIAVIEDIERERGLCAAKAWQEPTSITKVHEPSAAKLLYAVLVRRRQYSRSPARAQNRITHGSQTSRAMRTCKSTNRMRPLACASAMTASPITSLSRQPRIDTRCSARLRYSDHTHAQYAISFKQATRTHHILARRARVCSRHRH